MSGVASKFESVLVDTDDDAIGTITLNRPDKLNAFAGRMRQELVAVVRELAADPDVRVLVITGAGRAFCAGADIEYMRHLIEESDYESARALVEAGRDVVTTIRSTGKPVIASINGPAAGGGANLALACDLRIASEKASIGQTFNRIGLHPDWGGTYFLPRLVGPSKAIELVFGGDMIDAAEAYRIGLFSRIVPHEQLEHTTKEMARALAEKPPVATALAKKAIYRSAGSTLEQMLDIELDNQLTCFKSEDAREGLQAFLDKRKPEFHGK